MRRGFVVAALATGAWLAVLPAAGAQTVPQTRTCPIPVVGGDPDVVQVTGPVGTTWTATVDESPGEASHIVSLTIQISSSDGSGPLVRTNTAAGMSPVSVPFDLAAGHHYTVQWVATFDYGIHPCSSILPGQSPFQIDT
jgi:hypothetical protein